ncbi:PAS domain-containing protein [Streptomyces sp. NPDC000851]
MLDAEGTVVGWTQAAQQLVGYSAREMVGRSATHVLPSSEDALRATAVAQAVRIRQDDPAGLRMADLGRTGPSRRSAR